MDPLSGVTTLFKVVHHFYDVVDKADQHHEEAKCLQQHLRQLEDLIKTKSQEDNDIESDPQLDALTKALAQITSLILSLHTQPSIFKLLWKDDVGHRIKGLSDAVTNAIRTYQLGASLDVQHYQRKYERARRKDAMAMKTHLVRSRRNDEEILDQLGMLRASHTQMVDILYLMKQWLSSTTVPLEEENIIREGRDALERRSGSMGKQVPDFHIGEADVKLEKEDPDTALIEHGFLGKVYRGRWLGAVVAVKVFDVNLPHPVFQDYIDVLKRLSHPNILQFYGACSGRVDHAPFAVYALKKHSNVLHYLQKFPKANRLQLLHEAALGLCYLHSNGIVHGDIQTVHILIDEAGHACLSGFALSTIRLWVAAKDARLQEADHSPRTSWNSLARMARESFDRETDAYCFGVAMFEVFTGVEQPLWIPDSTYPLPTRPAGMLYQERGLDGRMWRLMEMAWSLDKSKRPNAITIQGNISNSHEEFDKSRETFKPRHTPVPIVTQTSHDGNHIDVTSPTISMSSPESSGFPLTPPPTETTLSVLQDQWKRKIWDTADHARARRPDIVRSPDGRSARSVSGTRRPVSGSPLAAPAPVIAYSLSENGALRNWSSLAASAGTPRPRSTSRPRTLEAQFSPGQKHTITRNWSRPTTPSFLEIQETRSASACAFNEDLEDGSYGPLTQMERQRSASDVAAIHVTRFRARR